MAIVKVSWGHDMQNTKSHLQYIAGEGNHKGKHKHEHIEIDPKRGNLDAFMSDYIKTYTADLKRKQRRLKRTDCRMIVSWKGHDAAGAHKFVEQYMRDNFANRKFTYALHQKKSKDGDLVQHVHILICTRSNTGEAFRISPQELNDLKASAFNISKEIGLNSGYDLEDCLSKSTYLKKKCKPYSSERSEIALKDREKFNPSKRTRNQHRTRRKRNSRASDAIKSMNLNLSSEKHKQI